LFCSIAIPEESIPKAFEAGVSRISDWAAPNVKADAPTGLGAELPKTKPAVGVGVGAGAETWPNVKADPVLGCAPNVNAAGGAASVDGAAGGADTAPNANPVDGVAAEDALPPPNVKVEAGTVGAVWINEAG